MAPFGQILVSASLRGFVVGLASPRLLILKPNLNGFSPDLGSKHPTDRSSVLNDHTQRLDQKSSLISGFWTPAGISVKNYIYIYSYTHEERKREIIVNVYIFKSICPYCQFSIHTYIHTYNHTYIHTYIYVHINIYINVYLYIYTKHTHDLNQRLHCQRL